VDKVFAGYPAVITQLHSNIARVFCVSEIRFSDRLRSVRRLRFHIHWFFMYNRKSAHITFLYFRSDLYACRRISLIGAVELFLRAMKTKELQQSKTDRLAALRVATCSYKIYSYNNAMYSTIVFCVVKRLIDP